VEELYTGEDDEINEEEFPFVNDTIITRINVPEPEREYQEELLKFRQKFKFIADYIKNM